MEKILLLLLFTVIFACNQTPNQEEQTVTQLEGSQDSLKHVIVESIPDCPDDWIATGKELKQTHINDSTEQLFLNDTLWFEVIGVGELNKYSYSSYLKLYRTNGLLEQEGNAIYSDHPIVDYMKDGEWKFYSCNGDFIETKLFDNGALVNNN